MSEGFLSRWSKRKQEAAREERREPGEGRPAEDAEVAAVDAAMPASSASVAEAPDPDAITPEELAALPPVEEVTDPAGFAPFLRKGVPALLRNAAMRRMWLLNPAIRDYVDPAVDYAYDWNTPGAIPGNGPLEAGYDAKAAAERIFSRMRGRISFETGEWEEQEQPSCDTASQVSGEPEDLGEVAASQQPGEASRPRGESSAGEALEPAREDHTLVVVKDAAAPKVVSETQEEQRPARRHGRALPV